MHTYIINYRSHSGSRFGLSLVGDSGWGPPFLSSSSMGEGNMQSVSFQDQPAVADDDEATERPTAVAEPSGSQLPLPAAAQTAVTGSSSETPSPAAELASVGPDLVVEPAPAEEPATASEQAVIAPGFPPL